jgi:hypothetical protein
MLMDKAECVTYFPVGDELIIMDFNYWLTSLVAVPLLVVVVLTPILL